MTLRVLDLFSGIGGFSLGLERTGGFKTVAFCEIEPFCRKVLAKHWPEVPCYHDVRELTAARLAADGIAVDVICGGFPCQDISVAGKGAGLEGDRSGLWSEYARIIGEVRPTFVLVENVAALLSRGLDKVLGDLASLGFDAEWHCISASAVGAPHRRDRIWIVGHAGSSTGQRDTGTLSRAQAGERGSWEQDGDLPVGFEYAGAGGSSRHVANAANHGSGRRQQQQESCEGTRHVADATRQLLDGGWKAGPGRGRQFANGSDVADADGTRRVEQWRGLPIREELSAAQCDDWWNAEPDVGRVAHGIPSRVHRLKGLGNAVVPQIPKLIGNAILTSLKQAEAV